MASVATCPHCGADLYALRDFAVGPLTVENGVVVKWRGQSIRLTRCERLLLLALVRADGAPVRHEILADYAGYEGDRPRNYASVLVNRLKKAFLAIDPSFDAIEPLIRGDGLRWRTDEGHLQAA